MSAENVPFPQRELTGAEVKNFTLITGRPQPNRQDTIAFLNGGLYPIKSNTRLMWLMNATMVHTLADLGANNETGRRLFSSGALLTSSVYQFVNGETDLLIHDSALTALEQREQRDLMLDGPQLLRQQAGGLCVLLERILPVLDPGDELPELAYIGASTVHQVLLESQRLNPPIAPELHAYEVDETWQDLSAIFKRELG
ncbi:hypothetical protein H7Y63_03670 [Polaromonas sp.]|nr:hypothetical protein [Candidatus Saccharibacteria bacterium]